MKLGYECWRRECKLAELVKQAISKTIDESRALAIYNLQKHVKSDDGAPTYSKMDLIKVDSLSSDSS